MNVLVKIFCSFIEGFIDDFARVVKNLGRKWVTKTQPKGSFKNRVIIATGPDLACKQCNIMLIGPVVIFLYLSRQKATPRLLYL